jgi:hypothetical protein
MILAIGLWIFLRTLLIGSAAIALENLALRHQLLVLQRSVRRPRLAWRDRVLWVWLSWIWAGWQSSLVMVQPATVLAWHRQGFQLYWRWKSTRSGVGRPKPVQLTTKTLARARKYYVDDWLVPLWPGFGWRSVPEFIFWHAISGWARGSDLRC